MKFLYNLLLVLFSGGMRVAAIFGNEKARKGIEGRKNVFSELEKLFPNNRLTTSHQKLIWFHCSSLGEFEQGRSMIEKLKTENSKLKILLTFFSPSGYEIRKNYSGADYIFYLPFDFEKNAKRFISLVKPDAAFFVKYDLWYNYLDELDRKNIPHYLISASFRSSQYFFKPYGKWALNRLRNFKHIFVQRRDSEVLLNNYGIKNATVTGDTRIDRVIEIKKTALEFPIIKKFTENNFVLICGSTWEKDEELISSFTSEISGFKIVIAPHEIEAKNIERIKFLFGKTSVCYSELLNLDDEILNSKLQISNCLVIDNIGMLSSLYQYGSAAYIGGGFAKTVHNTLEPAAFGLPVIFGPNYDKFIEAVDLISLGGAFSINSSSALNTILKKLILESQFRKHASEICSDYIEKNKGAVEKILEKIEI